MSYPPPQSTSRRESSDMMKQYCAAMRGESVPDSTDNGIARAATLRGIRHHHGFAISPAVSKLCNDMMTSHPQFTRARNARLIMSNMVPDNMHDLSSQPYCIWYPDFATEETYRNLAREYPLMRYQVGRACAAAGYTELYAELDLLPEVSIAEEAREGEAAGCMKIFLTIMAAPFRYAVLDDYTRSINIENPKFPACLNADTAVRSYLPRWPDLDGMTSLRLTRRYWDIEEDHGITTEGRAYEEIENTEDLSLAEQQLLYNPLPADLPSLKKDLLLWMAAYDGNIDRYARLCRPFVTRMEVICIVRGIYHHTMFARWWSLELEKGTTRIADYPEYHVNPGFTARQRIQMAINARRIMNNDTSKFSSEEFAGPHQPYLIWWPTKPDSSTLNALANKCPHMTRQVILASIVLDYEVLYKELIVAVQPNTHMWMVASRSHNRFYCEDLQKRADELGVNFDSIGDIGDYGRTDALSVDLEPSSINLSVHVQPCDMDQRAEFGYDEGPYFGQRAAAGQLERYVWATPESLRRIEKYWDGHYRGDINLLMEWDSEGQDSDGHDSSSNLND